MHYDKRNLENINKLAPNTKRAALEWYNYCKTKGINILVYETIRTEEQQREYVKTGKSQTMKSYHLVGQALDFVPVEEGGRTNWNGYMSSNIQLAVKKAKELGFEWGGDWKDFIDRPHLQYNYKGYGTDKGVATAPEPTQTPEQIAEEKAYQQEMTDAIDFLKWKKVITQDRRNENLTRGQLFLTMYRFYQNVIKPLE